MATVDEFRDQFENELSTLFRDLLPNIDSSVGTVLHELIIRPSAVAHAERAVFLQEFRDNASLLRALQQTNPDSDLLDSLLSNYNVTRSEGARAIGVLNIFTKSTQRIFIPATAIFTCGGLQLQPSKTFVGVSGDILETDTTQISYVPTRQFDATTFVFSIEAITVENIDTVLSAGQICSMTPQNTFVTKVEVGSTFTGGALPETTLALLERASTGINARILAGRDHIEAFLEGNTEITILDVAAFGMGDRLQLRDAANNGRVSSGGAVDIYVKTAPVPSVSTALLVGTRQEDGRFSVEIPAEEFPGAFGVLQVKSGDNIINTEIETVLGFIPDDTQKAIIEENIHARYSGFQTMSILFAADNIEPAVTESSFNVDIVFMPGLASVQDLVENISVRNFSFDAVVKGAVPMMIQTAIEYRFLQGLTPPNAADVQQQISDIINSKSIGTEALLVSEIIAAAKTAFPTAEVQMPINLLARTFVPEGGLAYASSTLFIKQEEASGIGPENSFFSCLPDDIEIVFTEIPA